MVNTSRVPVLVLVLFGAVQAKQQNCDDHDQSACQYQQRSWCNCSEPAADCKVVERGTLHKELTCKYRVSKQDLIVNRPKIQEVKLEKECPFSDCKVVDRGTLHKELTCKYRQEVKVEKECPFWQKGDNNTCSPRKTYVDEQGKAIKDAQGNAMTVFIDNIQVRKGKFQCEDIKKYFMRENTCDLNLEPVTKEEEAAVEMQDDVGIEIAIQLKDHDDKVNGLILEEVLRDECAPAVNRLEFKRLPAVVNFDCNPTKFSPMLLKKCCKHCVKFSKSEALKDLKADDGTGFVPFVNCGGCQTDHINMSGGGKPW